MANIANLLTEHMAIWTAADTEKKSGRGRASGNAGSVYGVKKLRELILELAVRGKLVPQDPTDEPASELLKRIQAEKAKLVAEGKLKKGKSIVSISEDEKPFELPKGWEWVHLPDVTDYKVGKTPSTKSSIYWTNDNSGYNWVSIADLNHDGVVTETSKKVTHEALKEVFRAEPVAVGTILMSFKLTLGKISILETPAFHNEAIISICPSLAIDKKYLFKILPARANEGDSKSAIKGNTLNSESIAALLLPLPPLAEQHRIVAKVDELMALCDQLEQQHSNAQEAHETLVSQLLATLTQSQNTSEFNTNWQRIYAHFDVLFTTEASIDGLKQTLLQLAVMGKLVPHDPNDEPASELLKRIQVEKTKLIAEGKHKKEKPLAPISEDEMPFELPNGWQWVRLGSLIKSMANGLYKPEKFYTNHGFISLRMFNIQDGFIDFKGVRRVEVDSNELNQFSLEPGDLLVNRVNSKELVGKTAIIPEYHEELVFESMNMRLKPYKRFIQSKYLNLLMQSNLIKETIFSFAKEAISQASINQTQISLLLTPLPPQAEQHRIVAKVDELMVLCDQLKTRIQQASQQQQFIADALVAQAVA